jgi:hypothetical protein
MHVQPRVILFVLSLFTVVILASCAKDGATGPSGAPGKDGNANVITRVLTLYDSTYTLGSYIFSDDTNVTTFRTAKVASITDSAITGGIVDSGMVLVFFRSYLKDSSWVPLPFKYLAFGSAFYYNIVNDFKKSTLRIYVYLDPNYSGATVPSISSTHIPPYKFKYLIISGTSLKLMKKQGVDTQNEAEVEGFLRRMSMDDSR